MSRAGFSLMSLRNGGGQLLPLGLASLLAGALDGGADPGFAPYLTGLKAGLLAFGQGAFGQAQKQGGPGGLALLGRVLERIAERGEQVQIDGAKARLFDPQVEQATFDVWRGQVFLHVGILRHAPPHR